MNERPIYKTPPGTRGGGRPGLNRRLGGLACVACVLTLAGATLGNGLVGSSAEIEELAAPAQGVVDSGGDRQSTFSAIRAQIARLATAIAPSNAESPTDEAVADAAAFHERIDATEVAAETPPPRTPSSQSLRALPTWRRQPSRLHRSSHVR